MRITSFLLLILCSLSALAITNGKKAAPKHWLVRVGSCSGILLNETTILTVAHCVYDKPKSLIILKRHLIDNENGEYYEYLPKAKSVHIHLEYSPWKERKIKLHDIAILKLKKAIPLHEQVNLNSVRYSSEMLSLIGYGKMHTGKYPKFSNRLDNLIPLPHKSDTFWDENAELLNVEDDSNFYDEAFFTGHYGAIKVDHQKSACNGDSGSPLFKTTNESTVVVGLVAHGSNDCLNQPLFFFTDIYPYIDWINEHLDD